MYLTAACAAGANDAATSAKAKIENFVGMPRRSSDDASSVTWNSSQMLSVSL